MITYMGPGGGYIIGGGKTPRQPVPQPEQEQPKQEKVADRELINQGLRTKATSQQKVEGLIEAGLHIPILAESIGVTRITVEKWVEKKSMPRSTSQRKIDNIRIAMSTIIDGGVDPEYAAAYMQAPVDEDNFPYSIMDVIGENPTTAQKVVDLVFK